MITAEEKRLAQCVDKARVQKDIQEYVKLLMVLGSFSMRKIDILNSTKDDTDKFIEGVKSTITPYETKQTEVSVKTALSEYSTNETDFIQTLNQVLDARDNRTRRQFSLGVLGSLTATAITTALGAGLGFFIAFQSMTDPTVIAPPPPPLEIEQNKAN